ncbi:hypothetical protein PG988_006726 [Apiospora saccharicola]
MDGTYGNVYHQGRTASPIRPLTLDFFLNRTPGTPTVYQTNINRTKTKKWVEAKVQNYDGDDWGDDYDDEEPEEPPPPSKPTGLRQPGQGATEHAPVTSPYGQTPTPHTVGPRAMPMSSHVRKTSTGLRTPSGAPPLHVQTQQHQTNFPNEQGYSSASGGTSVIPSATGYASPEPPNAPGPAMSPSAQSRGRSSSSTQAPGTVASARFPPRKSSMSRQDMPDAADVSSPRTGSRPGSSSNSARPWMDQRTNSPGQATNASNKPLPFVRPADIYRRMEEEKQRTSLDSSRPSMDSNDGGALRSPTGERRRASLERDDLNSDASRGLKTTLAPVAERRSEYGMDRLMSDANNNTPDTSSAQNHMDDARGNYITEEQSRQNKLELQNTRRLSVSPQLPDLTRLSGFGEDFFGSSRSTQEQPQYFLENPEPLTGSRGPYTAENSVSDQPHRAPSLIEGPALATSQESKNLATQPVSTSPTEANAAANSGGFGAAHNQMTSAASRAPRPSIPGGWVSETTNFGSEAPTPMESTDLPSRQLSPPQEEVSPVTESGEDLVPTTAVKQAQPLDTTPKMVPQADGFGGATGKHDQDVANEVAPTGPASHATPMSLPPLQTSEPEPLSDIQRENTNSTSTTSQPEVSPSQFVPTAPLNPRRIETSDGTFIATMPPRNLTMSSIETASPNESDRLRDDIMKSLNASPIHSAGAGALLGPSSGSLDSAARESTYLSGVYDDYLGPTEDKSLQETGQATKDAGKNNQPIYQLPSEMDTETSSFPVPPSNQPPPETTTRVPTSKRRFSWEGGPEEVSVSPTTDTNAPFFGADTSRDPAKSSTSSQSGPTATVTVEPSTAPAPAVHIAADNDGNMSHQVSMVSSRGPEGLGIAGLEPPSPVSILSNRKSLVSPGLDNSRRLSLADEKSLMEEASQPPSPPQAQHPALFQAPEAEEPMNAAPAPQVAIGRASSYPISWAEILSLPTLPMRAEMFEEARVQYAEMDSGLSNWLLHMQSNVDDMNAAGSQTDLPLAQSPTSAGAHGQQPYYQQYLNASNPKIDTVPSPGLGRQSTGNMLHGQQSSTGFGAHNQVGTKSKELLQAAAGFANKGTRTGIKSGMKLFNKGKSKFRGGSNGGDKVFQ